MRFYHTSSQPQYKTGGRYHGEWQENMKHGYGSRSWVNGNKYEGVRNYENLRGDEAQRHPSCPFEFTTLWPPVMITVEVYTDYAFVFRPMYQNLQSAADFAISI